MIPVIRIHEIATEICRTTNKNIYKCIESDDTTSIEQYYLQIHEELDLLNAQLENIFYSISDIEAKIRIIKASDLIDGIIARIRDFTKDNVMEFSKSILQLRDYIRSVEHR